MLARRKSYGSVEPQQLSTLRQARIVDVREPHEFVGELGHLPDAELVPLAHLADAMQAWPKNQAVAVICRSGGRSARAAQLLVQHGFDEVYNVEGGMLRVRELGLPVRRDRSESGS